MPTIELIGFLPADRDRARDRVLGLVRDLPFADALVFVLDDAPRRLVDARGAPVAPFLRISTGDPARAGALEARLGAEFDLELLAIRFRPRRHQGAHHDHD